MNFLTFAKISLHLAALSGSSWYDQKLQGWYYFQEDADPSIFSPDEAELILEEERANLQQLLSLAILEPTEANVQGFTKKLHQLVGQSARFAQMWGRFETEMDEAKDSCFLLFCFRGKDASSIQAAQGAKEYSAEHNWTLKALSLDGIGIEAFDSYEVDRGISRFLHIEHAPSLYLIDPSKNQGVRIL